MERPWELETKDLMAGESVLGSQARHWLIIMVESMHLEEHAK
jgi:hypothetical protein